MSPQLRGVWLVLLLLPASLATFLTTRQDLKRDAAPLEVVIADAGAEGGETARLEPTLRVDMTAYTSTAVQTDATPNRTASGAPAGPERA